MPRNPNKRPCQVPGCKAWAKHGQALCASHLASRAIGGKPDRVLPLLRLTATPPDDATGATGQPVGDDLAVIEDELRQLLAARALFMDWLHSLRAEEDPERPTVTPTQFLRAWSDSATRVVQLLRARAELRGGQAGALDALMQSVYDEMEALVDEDAASQKTATDSTAEEKGADGEDHDRS